MCCSVPVCCACSAGLPDNVRSRSGQPCSLCRAGDLCVLRPARRIHIRLRGRVLHNSPPPASVRSALAPTVTALGTLGSSARCSGARPLSRSLRLRSRRLRGDTRRNASLSSALAPSSLASPSIRCVFLRSICARRRPVSELNPRQMCRDTIRRYMTLIDSDCHSLYFVRTVIAVPQMRICEITAKFVLGVIWYNVCHVLQVMWKVAV